jgi:transposase
MDSRAVFVGIDVGKYYVDLAVDGEEGVRRFKNDDSGIEEILKALQPRSVALVVLEASGGYERQVLASLLGAGIAAVAVNPRQVRDFAKAIGRLEKTDRVDAEVLARFASAVRPKVRPRVPEELDEVLQWLTRRRQLVEMMVTEKNRAEHATGGVLADIREHIDWLKKRVRETERDLKDLLKDAPEWDAKIELLDDQKGLGRVSALTLITSVPELGSLNRKQIAKLVGIAPLSQDSGTWRGRRSCWGGRANARACLYMATLVATRHHPTIRAFYARLLAAGKLKKVALIACMRKYLTILNALIRDQRNASTAKA